MVMLYTKDLYRARDSNTYMQLDGSWSNIEGLLMGSSCGSAYLGSGDGGFGTVYVQEQFPINYLL